MKKTVFLGVALFIIFAARPFWSLAQGIDHRGFQETEECYTCHSNTELTAEHEGKTISLFVDKEKYEASVHGGMDCISCHNFVDLPQQGEEDISEKCADCHTDAGVDYNKSVHAESGYGPNCVSCHGAHEIVPISQSASPVQGSNQPTTCGECHRQASSQYMESFHGKAVALGAKNSPDCTYCHGAHEVLSQENPAALTSEQQKTALCADCHEGNVLGTDHVQHYSLEPEGFGAPMYWIKKVFMWLILLVVGFLLIHIQLDLWHKLRTRKS